MPVVISAGYLTSSFPPTYRSKENAPWRLIDFSQLGFIGKMFQSNELKLGGKPQKCRKILDFPMKNDMKMDG